ncbi:hypothetical protein FHS26_002479 [Rhizobium pisi]|uniref:Uncharacterized protein n=1 Tax=Rhizobium pisi TaxID=574561 RepID=A0A7W5FZD5_9HYPH|nr:hypothetical protein [Rhizobium pisi]
MSLIPASLCGNFKKGKRRAPGKTQAQMYVTVVFASFAISPPAYAMDETWENIEKAFGVSG